MVARIENCGEIKRVNFSSELLQSYGLSAVPKQDKDYWLLEATVLKQGVWNGHLIKAPVLQAAAPSLLGCFFMYGHPELDTMPEWPSMALGQIIGWKFDDETGASNALITLWPERCSPKILERFEGGAKVGVSSGHVCQSVPESGEYGDKQYEDVYLSMFHEHVALVSVGACKVGDGCESHLVQKPEQGGLSMKFSQSNRFAELIEGSGDPGGQGPKEKFSKPDDIKNFLSDIGKLSDPQIAAEAAVQAVMWCDGKLAKAAASVLASEDPGEVVKACMAYLAFIQNAWDDSIFGADSSEPSQSEPGAGQPAEGDPNQQNQKQQQKKPCGCGSMKTQIKRGELKTGFLYPAVETDEKGNSSLIWKPTNDEKVAAEAVQALVGGFETKIKDLQTGLDASKAAEGDVKSYLLEAIGAGLGLDEVGIQKYEGLPIPALSAIASDLGNVIPAKAAGTPSGGAPTGAAMGQKPRIVQFKAPQNGQQMEARASFAEMYRNNYAPSIGRKLKPKGGE